MPFTPYHFGPNGLIGLIFKKYLDIPLLILANVVIDLEVLFCKGFFPHRYWHLHTFLIGSIVGLALGIIAFPLRKVFKWLMNLFLLPYNPTLPKMMISGAIGACLHVLIDSVYHFDVQPFFWKYQHNPVYRFAINNHISKPVVINFCFFAFIAAFIIYVFIVKKKLKSRNSQPPVNPPQNNIQ